MSIANFMLLGVASLIFAGILSLQVLGFRIGKMLSLQRSSGSREGLGVIEGAVFALLGLVLAFQFSSAANRLENRRNLAVREANSIGTAYLRLDLLPAEDSQRLRDLFRQYLDVRIHATEVMTDLNSLADIFAQAESLQQQIWVLAIEESKKHPEAVSRLLLPAINEMIDITTERKAVGQTHSPIALQGFLVTLSFVGAFLAGHAVSSASTLPKFHIILFAAVLSITIYVILDMEFPRIGFIRIGAADQSLYDLRGVIR